MGYRERSELIATSSGSDQERAEPLTLTPTLTLELAMLQNSPMYAYIPAKNVARARQFYEQKLGFKPREEEHYDLQGELSSTGILHAGGAKAAWFQDNEGTSWR